MKRGFVVPAVLAVLACLAVAAPVQAQDSKFKIFAAAAYVSPLSDDNITFGSVTDSIEGSDQVGYDFGFEWRMSQMFGLEVDYVSVEQDVEFGGRTIGETKFQPLSATLNFHLIPGEVVDFYFGPTFSYVNWGDIDLNEEGQDLSGELGVPTDKESAWGVSLGIDFNIGEHFVIIGGVRYLQLDLTPENGDGVSIDPLVSRLGIGFRF